MSRTSYTLPTVVSSRSRRWLSPDHRGRFALGQFTREHDLFLVTVSDTGIITLTPADVLPAPTPPVKRAPARKRAPRKKAAASEEPAA
jgi:hypothetical protein